MAPGQYYFLAEYLDTPKIGSQAVLQISKEQFR
jgi:hypothetical protein